MKTITEYIDLAKARQGFVTDADLDYALGYRKGMIYTFKTGRVFPTEAVMVKLAEMAGVPVEQAILELSYWKADGAAKLAYEQIIQKLAVA